MAYGQKASSCDPIIHHLKFFLGREYVIIISLCMSMQYFGLSFEKMITVSNFTVMYFMETWTFIKLLLY